MNGFVKDLNDKIDAIEFHSVKSVQSGIKKYGQKGSGKTTTIGGISSSYTNDVYHDITISKVSDISKCSVRVEVYSNDRSTTSTRYIGILASTTKLRVFFYPVGSDSTATDYTNSHAYRWEVIEFL